MGEPGTNCDDIYIRVTPLSFFSLEPTDPDDFGSESWENVTSITGGVDTLAFLLLDPLLLVRNISSVCSLRVLSIEDNPPSSEGLAESGVA